MKDYYSILGVSQNSSEEQIRKNYRKLAMRFHPDRNPDDPYAEERFKEIAEAYGVLTDPRKRKQYDQCRTGQTYSGQASHGSQGNSSFSYSQEDILRDLFKDPQFQKMFSSLLREFQNSGFRHSSHFIRKSFFGGKANMVLGTIFMLGSMAGPLITGAAKKGLTRSKASLLENVSSKVGKLVGRLKGNRPNEKDNAQTHPHLREYDITYHTPLTRSELRTGKSVQILVYGEQGEQTLKVKIPPDSREGQKLRIRGKGRPSPFGRGDLFLQLACVED